MTQLLSPNGVFLDGTTVSIWPASAYREDREPLGTFIGYDSEDPEAGVLTVDDAGADAGSIDVTDAGLSNGSYYVAYQAVGDPVQHRYVRFLATDVT